MPFDVLSIVHEDGHAIGCLCCNRSAFIRRNFGGKCKNSVRSNRARNFVEDAFQIIDKMENAARNAVIEGIIGVRPGCVLKIKLFELDGEVFCATDIQHFS